MPLFQHDCLHCKPVGEVLDSGRHYDLYYCDRNDRPKLKARYGDAPTHVVVMPAGDVEGTVMRRARDKAIEKGYIKQVNKESLEKNLLSLYRR